MEPIEKHLPKILSEDSDIWYIFRSSTHTEEIDDTLRKVHVKF